VVLWWSLLTLGVLLRVRGLTNGGLRTSDAWVALTSRVPVGLSWHMFANAPGFSFLERSWLLLHPFSTWWGQLPPLALGIASIPAAYGLVRYFGFPSWMQLGASLAVSLSPICIIYSTRYKEYGADFLLACLLLALGERVRRQWRPRDLWVLAGASAGSFLISGSTLSVVLAVWVALALQALRTPRNLRALLMPAAAAGTVFIATYAVFYRHLSPALTRYWAPFFIDTSSPRALLASCSEALLRIYAGVIGPWMLGYMAFALLSGLLLFGLYRNRSMLTPALTFVVALTLCTLHTIPLGTGRTDEVLYPGLLLLLASGVQRTGQATATIRRNRPWTRTAAKGFGLILILALLVGGVTTDNHYDNTDVRAAAAQINRDFEPGDHVVVDTMMRYSWAYYEESPPHIVLGTDWMPGFTVRSTTSSVFVTPSFSVEGKWAPHTWVRQLAHYTRLWFVETTYGPSDPLLADLQQAGWRSVRTFQHTGCDVLLLRR
jgi:hypothetical protein